MNKTEELVQNHLANALISLEAGQADVGERFFTLAHRLGAARAAAEICLMALQYFAQADCWQQAEVWRQKLMEELPGTLQQSIADDLARDFAQLKDSACREIDLPEVLARLQNEIQAAQRRQG